MNAQRILPSDYLRERAEIARGIAQGNEAEATNLEREAAELRTQAQDFLWKAEKYEQAADILQGTRTAPSSPNIY